MVLRQRSNIGLMRDLTASIIIALLVPLAVAVASPNLDLYVTPQCPYGTRAENIVYAIQRRNPDLEVRVYYVLYRDEETKRISTFQGETELEETRRQLVIREHFPDKLWNYIISRNSHYSDSLWKKDAAIAGLATDEIDSLVEAEGELLLEKELSVCESLNVEASPTFFIDGVKLAFWDGTYASLFMILNSRTADYNLPACFSDNDCHPKKEGYVSRCIEYTCVDELPVEVTLRIIVADEDDPEAEYMEGVFGSYFQNLRVKYILHESEEAKKFIKLFKLTKLPAYIFDKNVKGSISYNRLSNNLLPVQDELDVWYLVDPKTVRPTFLLGRARTPGELTIFVMSECPYGTMAENDFHEVAKRSPGKIKLRYVLSWDPADSSFKSLHGESEIYEDRRQAVIQDFYTNAQFWDYLYCFNSSREVDSCLASVGIDIDSLSDLIAQHGDSLLKLSAAICDSFGINASPTFLWENQRIIDRAEALKKMGISAP